jgi:Na+-transporting NADH:ubiquinone oxidoreductase subunit NqrC
MKNTSITVATIAVVLSSATAHAQATYKRELPDSLKSQAKITEDAAAKTALAKVPKGTIEAVELEKEKGKLLYSYDIKVAGKKGVEEVHVDAVTGKFLSQEHESAEAEKKEAADEAKEKTKTAPAKPKKP